jgi:hypothetical protein
VAEYVLRFAIGGIAVSAFAVLADMFRPKSFAGLFGAAPSVALATLALALAKDGTDYAAIEGRSMTIGAVALCLYSILACQLMKRAQWRALPATTVALAAWLAMATGGKWLLLG